MSDNNLLLEQATAVATMWSAFNRQISGLDLDDPVTKLPIAQMRVCLLLGDGPRTMSSLSRELAISVSAITQIADRLERTELVTRVAEGDDRRMKSLQLTPHGQEAMSRRRERRLQRVFTVLEAIAPDEREILLRILRTLLAAGGSETELMSRSA